jgi:hypothetical protein
MRAIRGVLDSQWEEVSASLRQGILYVKVPREKVQPFLDALVQEEEDLILKQVLESEKAFVFYGPTDDWNEDLTTLKGLLPSSVVEEFISVVEAGLRNDARVDWISRIGGPPRGEADALENLTEDRRPLEAYLLS